MPKRPTTSAGERAAPQPRGAGHFTADTDAPAAAPQSVAPAAGPADASTAASSPPQPKWEERNERVTFHCPTDLLAAVENEMGRSGRSKSRVIVDALQEHLLRLTEGSAAAP